MENSEDPSCVEDENYDGLIWSFVFLSMFLGLANAVATAKM